MKYTTTLLILTFAWCALQAQQPAQYSLYMLNPLGWNPAYAGLDNSLSITGVFRKQWVGLEGSPTTQNLSAHLPLYIASGGFGINVENETLGARRWTAASIAWNYQKALGTGLLSLGIGGGAVQQQLDGSRIRTPDGVYIEPGNFNHNDIRLPLGAESASVLTFNTGVYYQNDWLDIGFSARNLNEGNATFSTVSLQLRRNYNFNLGLHFNAGTALTLHPSLLIRSDLLETQMDFSVIARYNDNMFAGASFRGYSSTSVDAAVIMAGFKLSENMTFAYAYDLTLSELRTVSNGSHEIALLYNLNKIIGKGTPPPIIYNPRSL